MYTWPGIQLLVFVYVHKFKIAGIHTAVKGCQDLDLVSDIFSETGPRAYPWLCRMEVDALHPLRPRQQLPLRLHSMVSHGEILASWKLGNGSSPLRPSASSVGPKVHARARNASAWLVSDHRRVFQLGYGSIVVREGKRLLKHQFAQGQ